MRLLSALFAACLALAVATAVAKLIGLAIILAAILAVLTRPRETLATATTIGVLNLVARYPLASLGAIGALAVGKMLSRQMHAVRRAGESEQAMKRIAKRRESNPE